MHGKTQPWKCTQHSPQGTATTGKWWLILNKVYKENLVIQVYFTTEYDTEKATVPVILSYTFTG